MPKVKKVGKDSKKKTTTNKTKPKSKPVIKVDKETKKSTNKEQKTIMWIVAGLLLLLCLCVIGMSASAYYLSKKGKENYGTIEITSYSEEYFVPGNEIADYIKINSIIEIEPAIDNKNVFVTDEYGILTLDLPAGEYTIKPLYDLNKSEETITISKDVVTKIELPIKSMGIFFYEFNTTLSDPPFDNKDVRQAFAYTLDAQKMVNTLDPTCNPRVADTLMPFDLTIKNNSELDKFEYDLVKALKLSEDVDNFDMDFLSSSSGEDFGLYFFKVYEKNLTRLPIIKSIDATSLEWEDFREAQKKQDYEFANVYWIFDSNNMLEFFKAYTGVDSETGFKSDEIEKLIKQGEESLADGDLKGYEEAVIGINNIFVEEAAIIPVHFIGNCN